jgi:hydrogenase/urease accessory protein HupE
MSRNVRVICKGLLLFALLSTTSGADAHEIGTTQVRFALHRDDTWSAEIVTPPTPLLNRLEAAAGQSLSGALDDEALRDKLEAFRHEVARKIEVRFDGVASTVDVSLAWIGQSSDAERPLALTVRATGPLPTGAQNVTWRYRLIYSTYAIVFSADGLDGNETQWLEADAQSPPFPVRANIKQQTTPDIVAQYLALGFRHIIPEGLDHILFVLGIFLLTTQLRPILAQVTAFTIAHSVTLGLTMYGIVSLAPRIVEPLIALSVAYVAIENVVIGRLTLWRPAVVFGFGLLHGMGFAGALRELRLPRAAFLPALVSFNAGIEAAQLAIIAAAFLAVAMWHRHKPWYRTRVVVPASVAIALTGLFWTVQRVSA